MTNLDEKKLDELAHSAHNEIPWQFLENASFYEVYKNGYCKGYRQAFADQQKKIEKLEKAVELMKNVLQGCSDGNCILRDRTGGQHTNGGCRCKRNAKQTLAEVDAILKGAE